MNVRITLQEGALPPKYQTDGSAGADVFALLEAPLQILPGERCLVSTGLCVEVSTGWEIQVRPRSGLALKHGITLVNSPGTIDSDYRGELKVILINHGDKPFTVENQMRICQIVLARAERAEFRVVDSLADSFRGTGGFGHTGI